MLRRITTRPWSKRWRWAERSIQSFRPAAARRRSTRSRPGSARATSKPSVLKTMRKAAPVAEQPAPVVEGEDEDAVAEEAETKGKLIPITRPSELLDAVLAAGRRGLSIQRYKGLGEMNAEQLWETTLDPTNRSLLRVEVQQADVADEIFTRLMGDVVEPRREFIQENALSVANLDV